MGFLKNVGKTLKKEISFKNLVKVAQKASAFIPVAGGLVGEQIAALQNASALKKEAKRAAANGTQAEAQTAQANYLLATSEASKYAGSIAKSMSATIAKTTLNEAASGLSLGTIDAAGKLTNKVVEATFNEWLKANGKSLAIGAATIFIFWKFIIPSHPSKKRWNMPINKTRYI